jgi:hypothetical protein
MHGGATSSGEFAMHVIFQERTTVPKLIKVSSAGEAHIAECQAKGLCLGCKQPLKPDEQVRRGLGEACYSAFRRAVRAGGEKLEKEWIKEGKVLNANVTGRPATNPFTKAMQGE